MARDAQGNLLKAGDKVLIPATLLAIYPGQEYCNCDVEFDHAMRPRRAERRFSSVNTCELVKVETEEEETIRIARECRSAGY